MIVVEKRIAELVNLIPEIAGFKPVYHYGEGKELNAFLIGRQRSKIHMYPLIYQTSLRETQRTRVPEVLTTWEAIIATVTKEEIYNTQREATTFKNVLYPTFEYLDSVFKQSGIITSVYEWDIEKLPNYPKSAEMTEHGFTDVVDAILIRCSLLINGNCINSNIHF